MSTFGNLFHGFVQKLLETARVFGIQSINDKQHFGYTT